MADTMYCYRHPDRETGVSCSECGRPICPDCMTVAPVGIRCPDHSGKPQGIQKVTKTAKRAAGEGSGGVVTRILIGANILVFLANLADGASLVRNGGRLFLDGSLIGYAIFEGSWIGVGAGEWWRMLTSAFLHGNLMHLGMNMLMLYFIGFPMEAALGRGRFLALYVVSGLAGSAGALLLTAQNIPTVGASGAIFGVLGAALVLERQRHFVLGGSAFSTIVLNLVITFAYREHISVGGHLGGLVGGALCALALARFGRGHALYGRIGLVGAAGVVGVAALSIAVAYWRVRGYA